MLRSLKTAALGMSAQQLNVDNIANNLANVNTTGFKKSSVEFQDLLYENIESGDASKKDGMEKPASIQIGLGNKPVSTFRSFYQGNIEETGNPLDLAIDGKGFIQVQQPDKTFAYTRDGSLKINSSGEIVTGTGLKLFPEINLPENTSSINVSLDGVVSAVVDGQVQSIEVGQLELVSFVNPAGLKGLGGNLYGETEASGQPLFGTPGEDGLGQLNQGYLEKSNVDVVTEMINLVSAQRAYEVNSKTIKTADELLSMTNNLKR